jgi:hypothetical protein
MATAKGHDGVCSTDDPEHAGLLEAGADDGLASGFDDARANKQVLATKLRVAHTRGTLKVNCLDANLLVVVLFEIHRMRSWSAGAVNLVHGTPQTSHCQNHSAPLRRLREVWDAVRFRPADRTKAKSEISSAFDAHKCLPLDASQNALRVVREATENK